MKPSGNLPADLAKMDDWAISYGAYSRSTVERAKRRLKQLGKSTDLYNLDQESLQSYVSTRLRRGATESALNHEFKDLRVWIRYRNLDVALPHLKEARTPEAWFPTDDEMERIIAAAGRSPDKSAASRDTSIMHILFFGGIRIGELIRLNMEDIRDPGIYVRSEKGEKPRTVGLPDRAMDALNNYVNNYRYATDPKALFTTKSGRISYPYARKRIKEIGAKAGVPRFHAHAARHKCATMLLLGYRGSIPVDIRQVQIHLGHSSLATTQRYTHITSEEVAHSIKDVYNSVFRRRQKTENGKGGSKMFVPAPAPDGADRI